MTTAIEQEYRDLLLREGFGQLLEPPSRADVRQFVEQLSTAEREFLRELVDEYLADDYVAQYENPYDALHEQLRNTLRASGLQVPDAVYVGEYPHHAYNAQARRARNGTLILLNTGLRTLLDRVAVVLSASLLTVDPDDSRRTEQPTVEQNRLHERARVMLAESVVSYISGGAVDAPARIRLPITERQAFGFLIMRSAEKFTVGHEFGHLLAGHLHAPPGAGVSREHEADELATLLLLREFAPATPFLTKAITAAGPFLFLAVDHLVRRVQREVFDLPPALLRRTHPPSDQRAAVLRGFFVDHEGPKVLQIADACVSWLSGLEPEIIATARRLLRPA
ncbi:hypothetical protein ACIBL3_35720 [Kribbella sp. NPDC050124]|uniref:hypothetical protein n=1 Tax=Kribbella sp. NPDC050124 TaxID=3364114 RepID=UPI0037BA98DD